MAEQTKMEAEIATLLVEALNLTDVEAASIDPQAPLFREGLGLDSIDALELALAVSNKYGLNLKADDDNNAKIFSNLRALAEHIEQNRTS